VTKLWDFGWCGFDSVTILTIINTSSSKEFFRNIRLNKNVVKTEIRMIFCNTFKSSNFKKKLQPFSRGDYLIVVIIFTTALKLNRLKSHNLVTTEGLKTIFIFFEPHYE